MNLMSVLAGQVHYVFTFWKLKLKLNSSEITWAQQHLIFFVEAKTVILHVAAISHFMGNQILK